VLDRIRYGHVIDFIDVHIVYRNIERHWPTFNVADIAICVGVGLMAIDMFTSKRGHDTFHRAPRVPPAQSGEPVPEWHKPAEEATLSVDGPPVLAEVSATGSGAPPPIL